MKTKHFDAFCFILEVLAHDVHSKASSLPSKAPCLVIQDIRR